MNNSQFWDMNYKSKMNNEQVDFGLCAGLCEIKEIETPATKKINGVPLCSKCSKIYKTCIKPMLDGIR
jgi:hypothetical protein